MLIKLLIEFVRLSVVRWRVWRRFRHTCTAGNCLHSTAVCLLCMVRLLPALCRHQTHCFSMLQMTSCMCSLHFPVLLSREQVFRTSWHVDHRVLTAWGLEWPPDHGSAVQLANVSHVSHLNAATTPLATRGSAARQRTRRQLLQKYQQVLTRRRVTIQWTGLRDTRV